MQVGADGLLFISLSAQGFAMGLVALAGYLGSLQGYCSRMPNRVTWRDMRDVN